MINLIRKLFNREPNRSELKRYQDVMRHFPGRDVDAEDTKKFHERGERWRKWGQKNKQDLMRVSTVHNTLWRVGVKSSEAIDSLTDSEILRIRNLGPSALKIARAVSAWDKK